MEFPRIDLNDPEQNEFVQDWLSAFYKRFKGIDPPGDDAIQQTIECVQEIYSPTTNTSK